MTLTNLATNPSLEVDQTGLSVMSGSTATGFYWRDITSHHQTSGTGAIASLRVNNQVTGSNGVVWWSGSLLSGTYEAACWIQILASTTNAAFVVRNASTGAVLLQKNWASPNNAWTRSNGEGTTAGKQAGVGFFSLSSTTSVEVVVGVGIYGSASLGSARFDELLLVNIGAAGMNTSALIVDDYFDGDTPDTTSTTYAWSGTTGLSTSTSTPAGGGSYQSWNLLHSSDFTSGSVPNPTDWYAQDGYKGTNGNGSRVGSLCVVTGGNLEIRTNGDNIGGVNSKHPITYGKVDVWAKKDPRDGYSPVIFLWPNSDKWGDDGTPGGELDIYEGDSDTAITSFMHNAVGHAHLQIGPKTTAVDTTQLHKYSIEWLPNSVKYLIDDVVIWTNTDTTYIPTVAMKLVLQTEVKLPGGSGTAAGTVRPNYPAAYSPPWVFTIARVDIYSASTSANHSVQGQALESLPNNGPGSPSILIDTSDSKVDRPGQAVEALLTDTDTAVGSVPGQPDAVPTPQPVITLPPCPQWRVIAPDGQTVIELTNWVDDFETLRGMQGWMAPPAVFKRDVIPDQPGQLTRNVRHDIREIDLPIIATRGSLADLEVTLDRLVQATNVTRGMSTLQRTGVDGKVSSLRCYCADGLKGGPRGVNGVSNELATPIFVADDPYWFGEVKEETWKMASKPKSWFNILPLSLGTSTLLGDLDLNVESDVETYPVWTIIGPGDDPRLVNTWSTVIDGETFETTDTFALDGHLDAGQALKIDTRPGIATVTGPVADFDDNWFPYATEKNLFPLHPGLNRLSLALNNSLTNSYITVAWRNRTLLP